MHTFYTFMNLREAGASGTLQYLDQSWRDEGVEQMGRNGSFSVVPGSAQVAKLGAILNLRLTLLAVSFLMCCVTSLCKLTSAGGRRFLWAVEVCLREGSSLPLLVSIEFKPVCTLIFPVVVSTERCGTPHLSLAQAWVLILCRLSFLYPNCCPASLPTSRQVGFVQLF